MTYARPEIEIEKFDIIEEITADGASAAISDDKGTADAASVITDDSIGSDLIIG